MSAEPEPIKTGFSGFRTKLLVAMMLVVTAATALALFLAQQSIAETVKRDFEREFQGEVNTLLSMQQVRRAALVERCRALARKPRIHAALEDNALELLYPSARDELLDLMQGEDVEPAAQNPYAFHALFYRFLDATGAVIPPPDARDVGSLTQEEERQLLRAGVVQAPQIGYLFRGRESTDPVSEVMAMPIISTETGQPIAVLMIGFRPTSVISRETNPVIKTGLWAGGQLHLNSLPPSSQAAIVRQLQNRAVTANAPEGSFRALIEGTPSPWLLFYKLINPGSAFSPAYQVCLYPLADSMARQHRLFWQFTGAGVLLLAGAFGASRFLSIKLSVPVEKLAVDSETNRTERQRAEIALEMTHDELQRSARFSANASHQLKTPVTVLRAGLEELLAGEKLQTEVREEIATLVHQTFRLTSIIEDLLLLSRMDAGRLKLELGAVNLSELIASWLDDLEALPDQLHIKIETDFPPALFILGEKRYTSLILQNLLENARKYNRPGGKIRVAAKAEGSEAILTVGNTGTPIPTEAQPHIFERFHRGSAGENVSGHGLGLNLARELARLHQGDLRLNGSDATWTEFQVRFRLASLPQPMKARLHLPMVFLLLGGLVEAREPDAFFDDLDEAFTWSTQNGDVRVHLSGLADLEYYHFQQPPPGLIESDNDSLVNPRLTVFLDGQFGSSVYVFVQARVDRGFDPNHDGDGDARLDEYALRYTPDGSKGSFNFQLGKFATVVGNWVSRHQSWDNPFVTAPLPYENPTGIFDAAAATSPAQLFNWSHVRPAPNGGNVYLDQYRVPIIWGPSYASGVAVAGTLGKFDYAMEVKNTSLSSRPQSWSAAETQWQNPTYSARFAYRPATAWNIGVSASTGTYLQPQAQPTLPPGYALDDYRETVIAQDLSYAWHHWQVWAECYEARFQIPLVGNADTLAYYVEAKYKFTPQFFGALRWNQQIYGDIPDETKQGVPWGRDTRRFDVAAGYRFTAHIQMKLQMSFQSEDGDAGYPERSNEFAAQFTVRF